MSKSLLRLFLLTLTLTLFSKTTLSPTYASSTTLFLYDGDGVRVAKIEDGKTTLYVGELEKETETGKVTRYYSLGGKRVATLTTYNSQLTTKYLVTDHLGSTRSLTNSSGSLISSSLISYFPYGTIRNPPTPSSPSRQYTSQINDSTTGLYFYNARYYNPQTANFLTVDSQNQRTNRYSYSLNNPLKYTDPSGNEPEPPPPLIPEDDEQPLLLPVIIEDYEPPSLSLTLLQDYPTNEAREILKTLRRTTCSLTTEKCDYLAGPRLIAEYLSQGIKRLNAQSDYEWSMVNKFLTKGGTQEEQEYGRRLMREKNEKIANMTMRSAIPVPKIGLTLTDLERRLANEIIVSLQPLIVKRVAEMGQEFELGDKLSKIRSDIGHVILGFRLNPFNLPNLPYYETDF